MTAAHPASPEPPPLDDDHSRAALFEGDQGRLPSEARWVLTELLGGRVVIGDEEPRLWEALLTHRDIVTSRLHDMYLDLDLNLDFRVAMKRQIHADGVERRILLRDTSWSREATAALLVLREHFHHQLLAGADTVYISDETLVENVTALQHADDTNRTAHRTNLRRAVENLADQRILLRPRGDADQRWRISPVIVPLMSTAAIERVTDWLTQPSEPPTGDRT